MSSSSACGSPGRRPAGIMADWGADVIKVEAPAGDPMRRMFAVTGGRPGRLPSPPFDLDNRGKRSRRARPRDGRGPRGDGAAARRPPTCSSPTCGPRPSTGSASGPTQARAAHPRLIYASVTGYGRDGSRDMAGRLRRRRVLGPLGLAATGGAARRAATARSAAASAITSRRSPTLAGILGRAAGSANAPARGRSSRRRCCAPASTASDGISASSCASASSRRPAPHRAVSTR